MHIIIFKTGTGRSGFTTEAGHEGRPGEVGGSQPSGRYSGEEYERHRAAAREAVRRSRERWRARQQTAPEGRKYNIAEIFASIPAVVTDNEVTLDASEANLQEIIDKANLMYPMLDKEMLKRFLYVKDLKATAYIMEHYGEIEAHIIWKNDLGYEVIDQRIVFEGDKSVHFSFLRVRDENKELGMPLVIKQAAMMKLMGARKGYMNADISIGKYAWAKEGVDYQYDGHAATAQRRYEQYKLHMYEQHRIDLHGDDSYRSFTKPWQWAQYKIPGVSIPRSAITNSDAYEGNYNVGKAFMLDSGNGHMDWDAVINFENLVL